MARVVLDLEKHTDLSIIKGTWRYAHGLVPGEPNGGLVDELKNSPARLADYDDSSWAVIPCHTLQTSLKSGFSMGWYRMTVTMPDGFGDIGVAGAKVYFETCIDDYGEIWVDGRCDLAFGETGRGAISGFNAPQRVLVTDHAVPGTAHVIALLAVNGPLAAPGGGYFLRYARLIFETS